MIKKGLTIFLCIGFLGLFVVNNSIAATEQQKQDAIDAGLAYLALTQSVSGSEGFWFHTNNGTLAATASAALAFVEEEYLPGDGSMYAGLVEKALNYIFKRAASDTYGTYFDPGSYQRSVYTTGIVAPVIFALGNALGPDIPVGRGTFPGQTYRELMQDVVYWFCWGQNNDGGWRYWPNYGSSDNSTAQWGGLPLLYAQAWGLTIQDPSNLSWDVLAALNSWVNHVQNANGGSGYTHSGNYVNVSKTGGLLVELEAIGAPESDVRVQLALGFLNSRWNNGLSVWYGNLMHPYAMWAVYKGLELYGKLTRFGLDPGENFFIGTGMPAAPGGFQIGQDWWDPAEYSLTGDWYSHYCQVLVDSQNADGSWNGYSYWQTPLATGWYINILNAVPVLNQPPEAVCQDILVELDENGEVSIEPEDVDGGSSDPEDDPIELSIDKSDFTCDDLGDNTVTLTVTDDSGAEDSCEATVMVLDVTPPEVFCNAPDTIVPPDAPISFTATATDNCEVSSVVITEYDCFMFTKKGKRIDKTESCVVEVVDDTITILDSGGVDDHITWTISATDSSGNTTETDCEILVVNPGK